MSAKPALKKFSVFVTRNTHSVLNRSGKIEHRKTGPQAAYVLEKWAETHKHSKAIKTP